MTKRRVLVTGTAGFNSFHLAILLLAEGFDALADYLGNGETFSKVTQEVKVGSFCVCKL